MDPTIRELKHRYRINIALDQVLPLADRGFAVPLSTGNPLFDAALTEKLQTTTTLTDVEHLQRSWELCRRATTEEIGVLADHVDGLLNNFRMLLALSCWERDDLESARRFVDRLPWHWRFAFPTAVLKPGAHFLTGWRRDARFRLVTEPRHAELRILFADLLESAPDAVLLKYRSTVKEAAALQRYRFEGERQRMIHDLCFENAAKVDPSDPSTGVIGTYVAAREVLATQGPVALATLLQNAPHHLPLTSLIGLLGNAAVNLRDDRVAGIEQLRDQTLDSATAVECLLRLGEWSRWLTAERIETLSDKVKIQILGGRVDVPFFRVITAFNALEADLRRQLVDPLLRPLTEAFGRQVADLLPPPGPITFVMPMNIFRLSSLLLYAVVAQIAETRLVLLGGSGVDSEITLDVDEVFAHLADDRQEMAAWLLRRFGSSFVDRTLEPYHYDVGPLCAALDTLDPQAPLVLDLPFFSDPSLLRALGGFDRVFNVGGAVGAPGEINISPSYYRNFSYTTPGVSFSSWARSSDSSARSFTEMLDRLRWFERLGRHARVEVTVR